MKQLPTISPESSPDQVAAFLKRYIGESCALDPESAARLMKAAIDASVPGIGEPAKSRPLAELMVDMADIGEPGEPPIPMWWVIMREMSHWMSAPPGVGKTTFAYNCATALAEGVDIWGIAVPAPVTTVYIDLESIHRLRAEKLKKLYCGAERARGRLIFLPEIKLPAQLPELIAECKRRGVELVIFDTAARAFPMRDENDNAEVSRSVTPILDDLKREGIASLVIGHTGKSGTGGARGASAIEGNVDVVMSMECDRPTDPTATIRLVVRKHRMLGFPPPIALKRIGKDRFERIELPTAPEGKPDSDKPSMRCRLDIADWMTASQNAGARYKMIIDAMKAKGHSESTVKRTLNLMKSEGDLDLDQGVYRLADPFSADEE